MKIIDAQQDMRYAYYNAATGLFASGCVWVIAGLFSIFSSPRVAVIALLVGGMFIYPASVVLSKALGRPGAYASGNALGALALEGTVFFILAIPLAFVLSIYRVEWFFPAMLLLIGGRYLTFATLYGMRLYRVCGASLAIAGIILAATRAAPAWGAFSGGVIELIYAAYVARGAGTERRVEMAADG